MKFSKVGQVSLVSAIALILASTFTACSPVTIDYVFVAGNKSNPGQIQVFLGDRVSGALSKVGAAVSSGGVNPVSEAVSTDYKHLYVANQGDNTLVEFSIGGNGSLTSVKTVTMSAEGNTPVAIAMNGAGTLLYVANTYQAGCSKAVSGASTCNGGALAVFPVGSDGSLGAAVTNGGVSYVSVGINPTAVNPLADGSAVYVANYNPTSGIGYLNGFAASSAGALTTLSGSPFPAGVKPVGIASDPTNRFVYVTDFSQNQLIAAHQWAIQDRESAFGNPGRSPGKIYLRRQPA
jgi:DNA-binding beta-propeller fold protein YncE